MYRANNLPRFTVLVIPSVLIALTGCHPKTANKAVTSSSTKVPTQISEVDLKSYKPNEAGAVMIIMYHRFESKLPNGDMNRTPDQFRKDLDDLYKRGYRPATVSEFVQNKMDIPIGKTPVVLTFDDAWDSQFRVYSAPDGSSKIDPNCAVGILETFHKTHPDWATKGTFFVLPNEKPNGDPFGQTTAVGEKFAYLIEKGYEIGNHTATHHSLSGMNGDKVQWEIGTAVKDIRAINPKAQMQAFALPFGSKPSKAAAKFTVSGVGSGTEYKNIAVLRASWRPDLSPITKNSRHIDPRGTFCIFNPYELERVKPNPAQAKLPGTLEYYLNYFDKNPEMKYVSGGNPSITVVPKACATWVDKDLVTKSGKTLQIYPAGDAGKNGGTTSGGLSVD